MNNVKIFVSVLVALILVVIGTAVYRSQEGGIVAPGQYDTFAQCVKDSGATFYGAFWCPHCQAQKKMFGNSSKLLPYVECSTLDGKSQLPVCTDKKVQSYPTWEFADGSRLTGEVDLATLAEKTNCVLPTDAEAVLVPEAGEASPAQ
jgi:hypothetical protein